MRRTIVFCFLIHLVAVSSSIASDGDIFSYWVPYVDTEHFGRSATYNALRIYSFEDSTLVKADTLEFYLNSEGYRSIETPFLKEGMHITSDGPLQLTYVFNTSHNGIYEDGTSSYDILEESYLGTEYWIPTPHSEISILAIQNNTSVMVDSIDYTLGEGESERLLSFSQGTHITSDKPIAVVVVNYTGDHYGSTYAYGLYPTSFLDTSYYIPHQHPHLYQSSADSSKVYLLSPWNETEVAIDSVTFQLNQGEYVSYYCSTDLEVQSNKPVYAVYLSDIYARDPWAGVYRHYEYTLPLLPLSLGIREAILLPQSPTSHGFPVAQVCISSLEDFNQITLITDAIVRETMTLNKGEKVYYHEGELEGWNGNPLHIEADASIQVTSSHRGQWTGTSEGTNGNVILGRRPFEHDVGVSAILAPIGEIGLDTLITPIAIVNNYGLNNETFTVGFQIGEVYVDSITLSLQSGETDTLGFDDWSANQAGTYIVSCSTHLDIDERVSNDLKDTTVVVNPGSGPVIYSISPNHGGNTGSITVEITGADFEEGAEVKLTREDQLDVIADSSITMVVNPTTIVTTFDLRDQELGAWDVVVSNPDGETAIFYGGFTIEAGVEMLWVDIAGIDNIRVGQASTFIVSYGNAGNVDAPYPYVAIGFPWGLPYNIDIPWALPSSTPTPEDPPTDEAIDVTLIDLSPLSPGSSDFVTVLVTPSETGSISMYARITTDPDPYFDSLLSLADSISYDFESSGFYDKPWRQAVVEEEWPQIDMSDEPPAGYVLLWDNATFGGQFYENHIAKSLGDGLYIEMLLNDGGPDLQVKVLTDEVGENGYLGAFSPPGYTTEHGELIKQRAEYLLGRYGTEEKSNYVSWICNTTLGGGVLQTNCLGAFHILNPEFRSYGLKYPKTIYDNLANPLRWEHPLEKSFYKYGGTVWSDDRHARCWKAYEDITSDLIKEIEIVGSIDPNDKAGPSGYGEMGYVPPHESYYYIIHFENVDTATVPALEIVITDSLDLNLDWSTLVFDTTSHTPTTQSFDSTSGLITWSFDDINLPPNVNPPEGEGWVMFHVDPKSDLSSGTQIRNFASIVFDTNDPMLTGTVLNTIDALAPTSSVQSLAQEQPLSNFEVRWEGADDDSGSGIRDYSIYVSDSGETYTHWLTTDSTSAWFTGENDHTYRFYSIAKDNVGHMEVAPTDPDAVTVVTLPVGIAVSPNPYVPSRGHTQISFFGAALPNSKIKIFNKAGELVRSLEETTGTDRLDWDATSDDGKNLASGVYIWVSTSRDGEQDMGKFAIIR